jgi:hypothetical protein
MLPPPEMMTWVPLHFGHVTLSPIVATGIPSMVIMLCALTTVPPCEVLSPNRIKRLPSAIVTTPPVENHTGTVNIHA